MRHHTFAFLLFFLAAGLLQAQKADRSQYPQAGEPAKLQLPEVQTFVLDNGLPVFLVEKHNLPIVQFNFVFNGGGIYDPADRTGLAAMTAELMDEGAGDRTALELSEQIDFLGISLSSYANREQLGVRLFTPTSRLEEAVPLLADVLLRPRFDPEEMERKRTEYLVNLAQAHDEANAIAAEAFDRLIFGENHPYGRRLYGTEAGLKAMTVADLQAFHQEYVNPANGYAVIVGDITTGEAEKLLTASLRSWTGGQRKVLSVPPPPRIDGFQIYLVDKPGAAQSVLRFGHPGVSRDTEDEYPLTILNTILGGSFTSRLNQNIREEHGYAYGARSTFYQPRGQGSFLAYAAVQTDVTAPAITEFIKELTGIREVSEQDAEKARNYQALGYPGEFERIESIAGNLSEVIFYNLPLDYLNRHVDRLLAVTKGAVEAAARTYIDPANMILVIVGDKAVIEDEVKALNLGTLRYLSVMDVLGPVPEVETGG